MHVDPAKHRLVMTLSQLTVVARLLPWLSRLSRTPCSELLNAWVLQDTSSQLCGLVAVITTVSVSPACSDTPCSTTCPLLTLELPLGDGRETAVTANPAGGSTIAALSGFALEVFVRVTVNLVDAPGATDPGEIVAV